MIGQGDIAAKVLPILCGTAVAIFMTGVAFSQCCIYWRNYKDDSRILRAVVLLTVSLLVAGVALLYAGLCIMLLSSYHDLEAFDVIPLPWIPSTALGQLVTDVVQIFFLFRLYRFSKRTWSLLPLCFLEVLCFAFDWLNLVHCIEARRFSALHQTKYLWTLNSRFSFQAVLSIAITSLLTYDLNQWKAVTLKRTNALLNKVFLYTTPNGAIPSVIMVLIVVSLNTVANDSIWIMFYVVTPPFLTSTLLSALNIRQRLNDKDRSISLYIPTSLRFDNETSEAQKTTLNFTSRSIQTPSTSIDGGHEDNADSRV